MSRIVVTGGGWSGVSAALSAKKAGAEVVLLEKTDLVLGAGNAGGIFRNNGRFTAAEEMKTLGAGELFDIMDKCAAHVNINFPGHEHASLYDVHKVDPCAKELLEEFGIELMTETHVMDISKTDDNVEAVVLDDGTKIEGDVFIDTTGRWGPVWATVTDVTCVSKDVLHLARE